MSEQVRWQYHVEYIDHIGGKAIHLSGERLINLGTDGWELVTIWEGAAYFKRPGNDGNRSSWLNWCPRCEKYHCPECAKGTCDINEFNLIIGITAKPDSIAEQFKAMRALK